MILRLISVFSVFFIFACSNDSPEKSESTPPLNKENTEGNISDGEEFSTTGDSTTDTIKVETLFNASGFDDKKYYELLIETHLCNPNFDVSAQDGTTPCSAKFFEFHPYNHKRSIEDAFLLQVKAGVNNYPYRRLLIFVREKGKLVLMNGIVGYLVERITTPNEIDDLIVAIFDDLGNDKFDRYDVLIRYKEGKYHFVEAVGDLHGTFDTPDLKQRASKAILERINEKELIF